MRHKDRNQGEGSIGSRGALEVIVVDQLDRVQSFTHGRISIGAPAALFHVQTGFHACIGRESAVTRQPITALHFTALFHCPSTCYLSSPILPPLPLY